MNGKFYKGVLLSLLSVSMGCAEYTSKPQSFLLPTSNRSIDTVLHRSDVRFLDCSTLAVIQTFDTSGKLIDAQAARGTALHCSVIQAGIEAGGRVGAAAVVRPAITRINNTVSSAVSNTNQQQQGQGQNQQQGQSGEGEIQGGQQGNNGGGNGDGDGGNPGTDNHHDNGDNN